MGYEVALIILYDSEKRFLLQHRTDDAKLLPGHWAFFGGGLRANESAEEAVKREAYEELNYKLQNPQLLLEQNFKEGDTEGHLYIFTESLNGDKSKLRLQEGQGWGWYNESEINGLKMISRDRSIIRRIARCLDKQNCLTR